MPDYRFTRNEREQQRKAEMAEGRHRTCITMAEGIFEELCADYKLDKALLGLDTSSQDAREWQVVAKVSEGVEHRESFWSFPSNEFKAILMLLSK